jgi:predicted unusual protein kinase regulating ubiquinone biosynthesis (AarF/ABC1/UbiB family)
MSDEVFRRIDALINVGLRLARSAPTGKVLLARIAAAIDPAWIPRPWGDSIVAELEAASATAYEPIDSRRVERILREAWGSKPTDELDDLDPDPAAVTPSSQVHRGLLGDRPVAVKIIRPGMARSVRQDLALLEGLLVPLGAAFPAVNPTALIGEFRERVMDELDLETEAVTQRRFHRALRGHPFLAVPEPIMRLSHESVLVSEWIDGVSLRLAPDRDRAVAQLVTFVIGAARFGIVHADPDPDDVLVLADERLAILDFGATRSVDPARVALGADVLESFVEGDVEAHGRALGELGWLEADHAATALKLARHALGELAGPVPTRLDRNAVLAARDRLFEMPNPLTEVLVASALPPQDLWPARSVAQLFGTIARVDAEGCWLELVRAALREGWTAELS